jgi:hypothetical protein
MNPFEPAATFARQMRRMIFALTVVVSLAACGIRNAIPAPAEAILEQADHFELLSLDPQLQLSPQGGDFHGYRILGSAVITDTETRKKLVFAFKKAIAENFGVEAACFNPRHGIRVTRNGKEADFVICFQCAQVEVYGDVQSHILISNSAQQLFDRVLVSQGVPVADR